MSNFAPKLPLTPTSSIFFDKCFSHDKTGRKPACLSRADGQQVLRPSLPATCHCFLKHIGTSLPLTPPATPSTMANREHCNPLLRHNVWHKNLHPSNRPLRAHSAIIWSAFSVPPKRCTTPSTTWFPPAPAIGPQMRSLPSYGHKQLPLRSMLHWTFWQGLSLSLSSLPCVRPSRPKL